MVFPGLATKPANPGLCEGTALPFKGEGHSSAQPSKSTEGRPSLWLPPSNIPGH
jgi:hypothetical protein